MTVAERRRQLKDASDRSNQVRRRRAIVKRQLRRASSCAAAFRFAADVIERPPRDIGGMQVGQVIFAIRNYGERRGRRLLLHVHVQESVRLERLSDRQRGELVALLRENAGRLEVGGRA